MLFEILQFQKKIKYLFDFQFVWLPISSDETEKSVEEQKRIIQFISRYINRENIEREREMVREIGRDRRPLVNSIEKIPFHHQSLPLSILPFLGNQRPVVFNRRTFAN